MLVARKARSLWTRRIVKAARTIVVGLVFLVAAQAARGDLTSALPTSNGQLLAASSTGQSQASESFRSSSQSLDDLGLDLWSNVDTAGRCDAADDGEVAPTIRNLPASPSSAKLLLSALLSVGAWHLVRSPKNLHFADVPAWYHPGGPSQIGHATPFDLDFSSLPLCCFEQPAGERPFLCRVQREEVPRQGLPCFLTITSPRGPPSSR